MRSGAAPRVQHQSTLLSKEENDIVFSLFAPSCESLATTVVQIFVTSPPDHNDWMKLDAGVLCLVKDHLKRSYYFRVYCPERRYLVWEHEVYNSMQYNSPRSFLHTFEAQDCIVAFNFANEEEATGLRNKLLNKLESKKLKREKRLRNSYYSQDSTNTKPPPSYSSNGGIPAANKYATPNIHTSATAGLINNIKAVKKKHKKKDEKKITKADIGKPSGFKHVSHVGWDVNKGFDAKISSDESPELKAFFQKAGVSDIQLQDKETRDFIYDFIHENGGIDRVVDEVLQVQSNHEKSRDNHDTRMYNRNGPPPLPMRNTPLTSRAAPPPPPSRTLPAPPPPTQTPPPPPPLRTPPSIGSSGPPPPPPPPMPMTALAPPPPMLPSTPALDMPTSTDNHSALMESIRSGTILKKVEVDADAEVKNDTRDNLLTQIRQGISLRPVQPSSKPAASGPPENSLADALARALAERSRVIHSESSTSGEDEDDDEWED